MGDQECNVAVALTRIGGETLSIFHVKRNKAVVFGIKGTVEERYGYPRDAQQLMLEGTILRDDYEPDPQPEPLGLTLVLLAFDKAQALHRAVVHGHEVAVRNLLRRVARGDEERRSSGDDRRALLQDCVFGKTMLQHAAVEGHSSVCEALLEAAQSREERGEMLAAESEYDHTALHLAAGRGHEETSRMLLAAAPSAEASERMLLATNHGEWTALHLAAAQGHPTVCRALLEAAPSHAQRSGMLEATDVEGKTATQRASHDCRLLLESAR